MISKPGISVLVLISNWQMPESYQQQLKEVARSADVLEIILVGKQAENIPPLLKEEPKMRHFQISCCSPSLMAEAGAFEASAEVLVILKQGVILPARALGEIPQAITEGCLFGGFIKSKNRWSAAFLKMAAVKCKGLFWFKITDAYFMSRQVYHHSGGFKHDGKLASFSELLCKQRQLSPYKFIFF